MSAVLFMCVPGDAQLSCAGCSTHLLPIYKLKRSSARRDVAVEEVRNVWHKHILVVNECRRCFLCVFREMPNFLVLDVVPTYYLFISSKDHPHAGTWLWRRYAMYGISIY